MKTKRLSGQSVWEFRSRDRTSGKAINRRMGTGNTQQFATEPAAREIVEGTIVEINANDRRLRTDALIMFQICHVSQARGSECGSPNPLIE